MTLKAIKFKDHGTLVLAGRNDVSEANKIGGKRVRLCITRGRAPYGMESWQNKDTSSDVDALAPSADLIFGFWNKSAKDDEAFEEYSRRWYNEKKHYSPSDETWSMSDDMTVWSSKRYYDAIDKIVNHLINGVTVILGCFCTDMHCHRYLVAEDVNERMNLYLWSLEEDDEEFADGSDYPMADDPIFDKPYDTFDESLLPEC